MVNKMESQEPNRFRALIKGIDRESIERRMRQHAPMLNLITSERGEIPPDAVVMSWAEYQDMAARIEQAEAVAAHAATRDEESFPDEVVARLVAGENPVKVFREFRALSVRKLAEAASLSVGYLSDIENGKRKGPIDTMKALAGALNVDLDMLV